jgi:guanylate kinase
MGRIVSFTGVSGVGKTMIAHAVAERMGNARMVASYTTRAPRPSDIRCEYVYVSNASYDAMNICGEFLWVAQHAGIRYGTKAPSISAVCRDQGAIGIMILVPSVIPALRAYLESIDALQNHAPVFIESPPRDVLVERLRARGATDEDIERRLIEAAAWDKDAYASAIPYWFIRNNGTPDEAVLATLSLLSLHPFFNLRGESDGNTDRSAK